jgi:hypothetical protein
MATDNKSKMGYRDDSPYRNEPFIDINTPNGSIDMSNSGRRLKATDSKGNTKILEPYSGMHQFTPGIVREEPMHQMPDGSMMPGETHGEYEDVELSDEEIEEYRRGGYVVEELPKAQFGGVPTHRGARVEDYHGSPQYEVLDENNNVISYSVDTLGPGPGTPKRASASKDGFAAAYDPNYPEHLRGKKNKDGVWSSFSDEKHISSRSLQLKPDTRTIDTTPRKGLPPLPTRTLTNYGYDDDGNREAQYQTIPEPSATRYPNPYHKRDGGEVLDLSDEEIAQYKADGYQVDELPQAQVGYNTPEYNQAYGEGTVTRYDPETDTYAAPDLPEFTITEDDPRILNAMEEARGSFINNSLESLSQPQKQMVEWLGGKQEYPSEAWGYENPEGFWQNAANFGMDAVGDPLNLIGAGAASKALKLGNVGKSFKGLKGLKGSPNNMTTLYRIQEKNAKTFAKLAEEGKIPKAFNNKEVLARKANEEKYFGEWFTKDKSDLDWYKRDREFKDPEIIELNVPNSELSKFQNYNKSLSRAPDREFVVPLDLQNQYTKGLKGSPNSIKEVLKDFTQGKVLPEYGKRWSELTKAQKDTHLAEAYRKIDAKYGYADPNAINTSASYKGPNKDDIIEMSVERQSGDWHIPSTNDIWQTKVNSLNPDELKAFEADYFNRDPFYKDIFSKNKGLGVDDVEFTGGAGKEWVDKTKVLAEFGEQPLLNRFENFPTKTEELIRKTMLKNFNSKTGKVDVSKTHEQLSKLGISPDQELSHVVKALEHKLNGSENYMGSFNPLTRTDIRNSSGYNTTESVPEGVINMRKKSLLESRDKMMDFFKGTPPDKYTESINKKLNAIHNNPEPIKNLKKYKGIDAFQNLSINKTGGEIMELTDQEIAQYRAQDYQVDEL